MSEEIWKPVTIGDGYFAQRFSVSNQGRVKNHETGRILHSAIWPIPKAHLSINGYGIRYSVRELVAHEFIGPRPEGYRIRTYGAPDDNRVTNLYYRPFTAAAKAAAKEAA